MAALIRHAESRRVKLPARLTHRHLLRHIGVMIETRSEIQRIERLMPLAEALACIDRLVSPVAPRRIKLAKAVGFSLAETIVNRHAHPGSAMVLRDGIAVRADATLDASSYAPARLEGDPVFVNVGDLLPAGADAVAPLDAVELRERAVHALTPLAPGDGVLPQGADAEPGDVLGRAGTRLRASDVEALSVLGVTDVEVRDPLICIAVADQARDGIIHAIVRLLRMTVEAGGGYGVHAAPDRAGLSGALETPGSVAAVILIGGSGTGRRDRSVTELAGLGSVAFHGIGLVPGETAAFGTVAQRPVLIVPGRLDAALAVWLTLGRRMLARLAGYDDTEQGTSVTLTRKISSTLGLAEIVPVRCEAGGAAPLASGYLSLQSIAGADGYVTVPADSEGCPSGTQVQMRPLP
jgi:molybdopterin molybdotransferase